MSHRNVPTCRASAELWLLSVAAALVLAAGGAAIGPCQADEAATGHELRFTGPLVSSAPPLPEGVWIVEPYLIQTHVTGRYDTHGHYQGTPTPRDDWQVALPIMYGVSDRLTISLGLNAVQAREERGGWHWATSDSSVTANWLLAQGKGTHTPAVTLMLKQNLPTGEHDLLEQAGLLGATGSGAHATTVGVYGQAYFLPGRNLRGRLNLTWRLPGADVDVDGRSAYGTEVGFHGSATLGDAIQASGSFEYSINPRWVLATDLVYEKEHGARVRGTGIGADRGRQAIDHRLASSWRVSLAPAVEYNWSDRGGVIVGALVSLRGRNSAAIVSPQVAVNLVF